MNNPKHTLPNGWSLKKLGEVFNITSGTTPSRAVNEYFEKGTHLWVKTTDLNNHFINDTQEKVTDLAMKETSLKKMPVGTVLVAMYGGFNQIGRTGLLQKEASVNQALSAILPNYEVVEPYFLLNWLNCKIEDWKGFAASSRKDPNITKSDVVSFPIILPPLPEQQKIAVILGTWDTATQTATALLAQLEKRKKGLMQRLLSGNVRLKGFEISKWQMKELEDMLIPTIRAVPKPNEQFLGLGLRSHGKGTFLKYDFEPDKIEMDTLYEVKQNDLIVNITFAWEGAIAIAEKQDEGALVSHRFPTYTFNEKSANSDYFKHFIKTQRFRFHLVLISPGGAGRNRVMSKKDFLKLEFKFPPLAEQIRIAEILNAADAEIRETKGYLEKLKQQKRGLMQQLLTGKVRVITT